MDQQNSKTINDLDDYSLDLVFRYLNVIDIRICSRICIRWYILTLSFDKECLVLNFGTCSSEDAVKLRKRIKCIYGQSTDQSKQQTNCKLSKIQPQPFMIESNRLLTNFNLNFLKTIKTFIFNGNDRFMIADKAFRLEDLTSLEYLEINDYYFFSLITTIGCNKVVLTSLKYLIVDTFILSNIYKFPNLVYVRGKSITCTWSFQETKLKHLDLEIDNFNDRLLYFFIFSCQQLEFLNLKCELKDDCNRTLADLLHHLGKLKELNLNLKFDDRQLTKFLSGKLNCNENLKLTINNLRIKTAFKEQIKLSELSPIYSWDSIIYFYIAGDKRPNFDKTKYFQTNQTVKIANNDDVRHFQKHSKQLKHIKGLIVQEFYDALHGEKLFKINIKPMMESLPKTLKYFKLFLSYKMDQDLFDLLPAKMPFLEKFEFIDQVNNVYDFEFLSRFAYLSTIKFHFVNIENIQQLVDALEKCKFLSSIHLITSSWKKGNYYRDSLTKHVRRKESSTDSMMFDFLLNGTKIGVLI